MACHYVKSGTMPIVVGAWYARDLRYVHRYAYELLEHNEETHTCVLSGGWPRIVSEETLSNWHIVRWPVKAHEQ